MLSRRDGSFARGRRARPSTSRRFAPTIWCFAAGRPAPARRISRWRRRSKSLKQKQIGKIVLVRPAVEAGENLGFLPGDMQAKINPYLRPLLDALREMMDYEQVKRYMADDVIEVVPLAYMRGRTLNNAFIIMDEAQNTTVPQMKMFLTRMGLQVESRRVGRYIAGGPAVAHEKRPDRRNRPTARHRRICQRGADARGYCAASVGAGDRSLLRGGTEEKALKATGCRLSGNQFCRQPTADSRQPTAFTPMSTGSKKKRRIDRVTSVELPPGVLGSMWGQLRRGHVLVRLALCAITAMLLWANYSRLGSARPALSPGRRSAARYRGPHAIRARRSGGDGQSSRSSPQVDDRHVRPGSRRPRAASRQGGKRSHRTGRRQIAGQSRQALGSYRLPLAEGTPKPTDQETNSSNIRSFAKHFRPKAALDKFKAALDEASHRWCDKGLLEKLAARTRRQ